MKTRAGESERPPGDDAQRRKSANANGTRARLRCDASSGDEPLHEVAGAGQLLLHQGARTTHPSIGIMCICMDRAEHAIGIDWAQRREPGSRPFATPGYPGESITRPGFFRGWHVL